MATASIPPADAWPYKMRDLCRLTGLPRQAIHFYIQQGLVPPGHKTGRNTARYGEAHVERIRVVKRLQADRFMPLRAIRAVLDGEDDGFTPEQRSVLLDVKQHLPPSLARPEPSGELVDARALLARNGLDRRDLDDLVNAGLVEVRRRARGRLLVASEDAWMFELLAEVRRAGFTRELGFDAELLRVYERTVAFLFEREKRVLAERLAVLPPDRVAAMLQRALPLVHQFFARYHTRTIREFFADMEERT